ncbi:MAG: hypothetical protein WCL27_11210 [Betaproteobacteria bacterium]
MKLSLMSCLRTLADPEFLKPDIPEAAIDMLVEKGLVERVWFRGMLAEIRLTEKSREILGKGGD